MEKQPNFILKPSLKSLTLGKLVTFFWDQDSIRALVSKFRFQSLLFPNTIHEWYLVVNEITGKISKLPIVETLKQELISLIQPIGTELLKWKIYHGNIVSDPDFPIITLDKICWTDLGSIDLKMTAEAIVTDDSLDVSKRYRLACIYCFDKYIPTLWGKIPEEDRKDFYSIEQDLEKLKQKELVVVWTKMIDQDNGTNSKFKTPRTQYQYAFKYAASAGNRVATEYFLQKIHDSKKEECLMLAVKGVLESRFCTSFSKYATIPKSYYCEVLCYLLSQMEKEQKKEVFESKPFEVLRCFLDWPLQELFTDVSHFLWGSLSLWDYSVILDILIQNRYMYRDSYRKLFGEIWLQSPVSYKEYVLDHQYSYTGFISHLIRLGDKASLRLVLKSLTAEQRDNLVMRKSGPRTCRDLCTTGKWSMLELFLRECRITKRAKLFLKEQFLLQPPQCLADNKVQFMKCWGAYSQLLDECCPDGPPKRCTENESNSNAKSFKSEEVKQNEKKNIAGKRKRNR